MVPRKQVSVRNSAARVSVADEGADTTIEHTEKFFP